MFVRILRLAPEEVYQHCASATGQFRRFGDVGDWSAYPSIAVNLVRCSELTRCARNRHPDKWSSVRISIVDHALNAGGGAAHSIKSRLKTDGQEKADYISATAAPR
jgi:hypothetical protein